MLYTELHESLLQLGLHAAQVEDLERLLIGVLAIGNIDFQAEPSSQSGCLGSVVSWCLITAVGDDAPLKVANQMALEHAAHVLGVDADVFSANLAEQTISVSGETFLKPRSRWPAPSLATLPLTCACLAHLELLDVRDATAKEIYDRLFSWLFQKANELLAPAVDVTAGVHVPLGVLGRAR